MKNRFLVFSGVLNAALIAILVVLHTASKRTAYEAVADAAAKEVRLQEHILAELESDDAKRIEAVRETLRYNIQSGRSVEEDYRRRAR